MNEVEGIFDRLKFWEAIKVYHNVTVGDLMKLLDAAKTKDAAVIRPAVVLVADHAGFAMDAKEIDDVVDAVLAQDTGAIVYEVGDYLTKFATQHLGYLPKVPVNPVGPIRMMAAPGEILDVRTMTSAQSRDWLSRNREKVKEGANLRVVKKILERRCPEAIPLLSGEMTAGEVSALSPEQVKKIIDALRTVSKLLTWGSIIAGPYAPLVLIVANAINLIIARYDALHPTTGETASGDHGLGLEDFALGN